MDPRIKLLIEGVRTTHYPIYCTYDSEGRSIDGFCKGCKGLVTECPVLIAAKELEDEFKESS